MLGAEQKGAFAALPGVTAVLGGAAVDLQAVLSACLGHVVIVLNRDAAELTEGADDSHVRVVV